jgi:hypothetical protein
MSPWSDSYVPQVRCRVGHPNLAIKLSEPPFILLERKEKPLFALSQDRLDQEAQRRTLAEAKTSQLEETIKKQGEELAELRKTLLSVQKLLGKGTAKMDRDDADAEGGQADYSGKEEPAEHRTEVVVQKTLF